MAIEIGGNVEGFAALMNEKAKELGLTNTHFVTPHGLDNPEHYTTAVELAKLTDYAMKNEKFAQIVGTKTTTIYINNQQKQINNTNELLGVLNGVIGVKTGFTNNAGRCLVTETKRGDIDIITVVLGADTKKIRTQDSIKLIEYTYANFSEYNLKQKAEEEFESWKHINNNRIEIIKGKTSRIELELDNFEEESILVKQVQIDKLEYTFNTITTLEAPVLEGQKIGTLIIKLDGEIIETVDIICSSQIDKKDWWDYFKENFTTITRFTFPNI